MTVRKSSSTAKQRLNVLFVTSRIPYPPHHGHTQRTFNLIKGISKKHNLYLMALAKDQDELRYLEPLRQYCQEVHAFVLPLNKSKWQLVHTIFASLLSRLPFTVTKYYIKPMKQKIQEIVKQKKVDLLHCDILFVAEYAKNLHNLPKVLANHNVESVLKAREAKYEKNLLKKAFLLLEAHKLKRYEEETLKRFDHCLAVSQPDADIFRSMNSGLNITIVSNGVDIQYFQPNHGEVKLDNNNLIFVGGMDWFPNRDAVLYFCNNILPRVRATIRDVKFTVVGRNPLKKPLLTAKNKGIEFTGFVEDVRPYIAKAAVYVVPLRVGSGTRLKILEAMAMEKAIVSTSIGCEGLEVTPGKNILIADKPIEFANNTVCLLQDPTLRTRLGQAARKLLKQKYKWQNIVPTLDRVWQQVGKPHM